MSVEIQWTDTDPASGDKRFVRVRRFSGRWEFQVRFRRREDWQTPPAVSVVMWEELLDGIERRAQRREGVTEEDVQFVKGQLAVAKRRQRPQFDGEVTAAE